MANRVTVDRGILSVNGLPEFLLTADYPYYRDLPHKWPLRLAQLQQMGVEVISFYVPWRHHEVEGRLDFTGETLPARNVAGFLRLLQSLGLRAVLKPGPFVHAELNFGGLPDRLDPSVDRQMEFMLDAQDQTRPWHRLLPAPLCERWQQEVAAWYQAVRTELIEPFAYPGGPIVALQVLNEGIYSDANRPFTAYDYSPSSLRFFARWQQNLHPAPAPRQAPHSLTAPAGARAHMDWALAMGGQLAAVYQFAAGLLASTGLPLLSNMHPPESGGAGLDWWLAKVTPEDWGPVAYGFTNWIGVVSHDPTAFFRYLLLVKRAPGPNMEENWGFSDIYDARYRHTVVPFYQTLLAMAAGTTGINIYTGAGTEDWAEELDQYSRRPYPDTAPIGSDGTAHPKGQTLRLLAEYIARWGREWVESQSEQPVAYGIYPPYAALAGWSVPRGIWRAAGVEPPVCGDGGLDGFMAVMRRRNLDFGLVSLTGTADLDPATLGAVALVGGFFMAKDAQERLSRYVQGGGHLIWVGDLPSLDGDLATPCEVLSQTAAQPGRGRVTRLAVNPFAAGLASGDAPEFIAALGEAGQPPADGAVTQVWIRRHPTGRAAHVVVLSLAEETVRHRVQAPGLEVTVTLPGRSGALLRVEDGRLSAALIKGINDCDGQEAVPEVFCNGESLQAGGPGDWFWVRGLKDQLLPWSWRQSPSEGSSRRE